MPAGTSLLLITAALIYFGFGQRLLDRLRLNDSQALIFIALMIGGSFITIPLSTGRTTISLNVGGGIIPLALVGYLLLAAETGKERVRAVLASLVTAAVVFAVSQFTDFDPSSKLAFLDPLWLFSLIAGIVGYLAGRSRRASFISGVLGIFITDLIHLVRALLAKMPTRVVLGGAGVFDSMLLAGFIAVGLAELVGESRERLEEGGENL